MSSEAHPEERETRMKLYENPHITALILPPRER